jgi:transcriptional regulator of aromatic amino acid metabolism
LVNCGESDQKPLVWFGGYVWLAIYRISSCGAPLGICGFVTGSEMTIPLLQQANKAACLSDITVLIEGETGTGKQVLAHAIHQLDKKRRLPPFITVNRSTINEALAEITKLWRNVSCSGMNAGILRVG